MATLYSDQFPVRLLPADQPLGYTATGSVRCAVVTYTMTGSEAASDKIVLFPLEKGSHIIKDGSVVKSSGVGVTATLHVGDEDGAGDNDRYCTSLDVAAAGLDDFDENPVYTLTSRANITATFATLSTPTEGGVLTFRVLYRSA